MRRHMYYSFIWFNSFTHRKWKEIISGLESFAAHTPQFKFIAKIWFQIAFVEVLLFCTYIILLLGLANPQQNFPLFYD